MNDYQLVQNWPDLPPDFQLGNPTGLGIDTNQAIFIFHRADRTWSSVDSMPDSCISAKTILILDRNTGKRIDSWGDNIFIMPHGLTVDRNNNIWVTDVALQQVFKFSHDGKLLMTFGEAKIPGNDSTHFNLPTDVAVAKDGSFYVSDGYGNSRVVKYSSAGKYILEWGSKGNKEGEFNLPHAIDLDDEGNVYVADRENNRVQVFTPTGRFIKQWADSSFGRMSSVVVSDKGKKDFLTIDYVTSPEDGVLGSDILFFDSSGNFIGKLGKSESMNCWYHNVAIDNQENIYVTDILCNKIYKFKKIK